VRAAAATAAAAGDVAQFLFTAKIGIQKIFKVF
jgi:hypothetical protein